MNIDFILTGIGLGIGLAMDAFSVCIANGLKEPDMKRSRHIKMAGIYAFFQFAMPMIGWFCVHTISQAFEAFQKFVPLIALLLLLYIGGEMILEGIRDRANACEEKAEEAAKGSALTTKILLIQGIATSIDALSVGFTITDYSAALAFVCSLIIAVVTFIICMAGIRLGKIFGTKLDRFANFLGGGILILIGCKIFFGSLF